MMNNVNVGIVGNGFVGNAVYQNLRDKVKTKIYDVDKNRCLNPLEEVIQQDFIFVCLPTPMRMDGSCDLSILDKFFEDLPDHLTGTFVIKSTVPVGTTKKYTERHNVIHNPEFLTARNAVEDYAKAERNVVGGSQELCVDFICFFEQCFPEIQSIITSSDESEAIKYFSNVFLAYKVAYFNKIYDFCQAAGIDYDKVREGVTGDSRIGKSHTQVPGIDNDRGFGGTCFPKDLNSLITQFEERGVNCDMLKEVWLYNEEIRTVIDWASDMKSKLNYAATIFYLGAVILTGGLVYLGHSNHRLSDSNDELTTEVQALIEAYLTSDKDCYLLAPKPDDYIIWEEMPYKQMI